MNRRGFVGTLLGALALPWWKRGVEPTVDGGHPVLLAMNALADARVAVVQVGDTFFLHAYETGPMK